MLVLDGGVIAKDVAIADSVDFIAGIAVLVFVLVELEGESALVILFLRRCGREGNAYMRSKKATNVVGGIDAAGMAHQGRTCQPLANGLAPFHDNALNSILRQESKDVLGYPMRDVCRGRSRNDTDPYDDGTETPGGPWVKKRATSMDDHLISRAIIRPLIWKATVS